MAYSEQVLRRAQARLAQEKADCESEANARIEQIYRQNPRLREIQGAQSRITQFEECFVKYPNKDTTGGAVFSFVFVRKPANLEDLQEDTSLQRKLKKLYLEGDCIHTYSGAIFVEE